MRVLPLVFLATLFAACSTAQPAPLALPPAEFPGIALITEPELRADLFALAGDHFGGREAGTLDEIRASTWLADRARVIGLRTAAPDSTYFQWFPLRRIRPGTTSTIAVAGDTLRIWQDAVIMSATQATASGPVVWIEDADAAVAAEKDVAGRIVAVAARSSEPVPTPDTLAARYFITRTVNAAARPWLERGAAAVFVVADAALETLFDFAATNQMRGSFTRELGQPLNVPSRAPTLLVRSRYAAPLQAAARAIVDVHADHFTVPSVNIIGVVPGTDPALRNEYVLFSAHQDHDGVRAPVNGDSIFNGADDNASTSVALLAIARAWVRHPARRSALFVWHGAEDKGLNGSLWHAQFPVVPLQSIVAVLNGDMIGRNHPDSAALLGVIPPHRNSTPLVQMALDANRSVAGFAIDSSWDRASHPEGWYFRSDHLPYAQERVPALFFTTLLHRDYHTPGDNPDRIDVAKLARMTRWLYATGWLAANAQQRPTIDPGFQLERERR
ncbi:MAG: M28 family peptidase [Gemmatimonadota bacterium]